MTPQRLSAIVRRSGQRQPRGSAGFAAHAAVQVTLYVDHDGVCDQNHGNADCCTGDCVVFVAAGQAVCTTG